MHDRAAGVSLEYRQLSPEQLEAEEPLAKGIALRITRPSSELATSITQSNAILRTLADAAQDSGLYGDTEHSRAQVDQWLEMSWHEVEVPLAVIAQSKGAGTVIAEGESRHMRWTLLK